MTKVFAMVGYVSSTEHEDQLFSMMKKQDLSLFFLSLQQLNLVAVLIQNLFKNSYLFTIHIFPIVRVKVYRNGNAVLVSVDAMSG